MQVWNGTCKYSKIITLFRLWPLRSDTSLPVCGGSQHSSSYHCTRALLWPRDPATPPAERWRRRAVTSSGIRGRTSVSTKWQDESGGSRDENKVFNNKKPRRKEPPPAWWEKKPGAESRMSAELQKLRLEDFPMESPRTRQDTREDRPFDRDRGDRPFDRDRGDRPSDRDRGDRPFDRDRGDRPSDRYRGDRPFDRDRGDRPSDRDRGDRPSDRDRGDRQLDRSSRGEKQYDLVFGVAPCLLALTQGRRKARRLFVKEGDVPQREAVQNVCEEAHRRGVQIVRVSKKELDRMNGGRVHQGLCLQASPLDYLTEERAATPRQDGRSNPLWLVLDGVQDPMNLGAILRSAYFLGVDRVASGLRNSCPLTPVVSKASSGVMEIMGVYGFSSLADMIKVKVEQGWQAVGTVGFETRNSDVPTVSCSDFQMTKPTLLLMGGEGHGLSPELRPLCEVQLTILPHRDLHPGVESLNVSVATGILLHSILSSRRGGGR